MSFNIKKYLLDPETKPLILDGGLGSQLEDIGYDDDMNDSLWSTILYFKYPEVVKDIHIDFLEKGADIITIGTYQTSQLGLEENKERLGIKTTKDIEDVFSKCIDVGDEARNEFWAKDATSGRIKPLVAGSVGPYGAYKADRSEYSGYYPYIEDNFEQSIRDFHQLRLKMLFDSDKIDFTMFETIPNFKELKILIDLSHEINPEALYTISLSLRSFDKLLDGTDLKIVMQYINALPQAKLDQIIGIGTNCSPLLFSHETMKYLSGFNDKNLALLIYPNSGEVYDKSTRTHSADPLLQQFLIENNVDPKSFHDILSFIMQKCVANGAKLVGGCCRITPQHIKWIHDSISG